MLQIAVPQEGAHQTNHRWLTFEVPEAPVMIAGSRNGLVLSESARLLVQAFHHAGLSCSTGCATGIDERFRKAFSQEFREDLPDFVACAFQSRVKEADRLGLPAQYVSDPGMHPVDALRHRTQWLAYNCSMLVLFPDDPNTGQWAGVLCWPFVPQDDWENLCLYGHSIRSYWKRMTSALLKRETCSACFGEPGWSLKESSHEG